MEIYNSEQEQVEALKAWWDKNGTAVIAAIVAALLAVGGWKYWQGQQHEQAEQASAAYQQMMDKMVSEPEAAMEQGRAIIGEYSDTIYAAMTSLAMARIAVEQGDLEAAAAHLKAAAGQTDQQELQQLARLRLAKVLFAQGQPEQALSQLQGHDAGTFQAAYDELRGDILLAQGDKEGARKAYTNALTGYANVADKGKMVQLKLDDLAESKSE